jgi:uncharacterized protein YkwD
MQTRSLRRKAARARRRRRLLGGALAVTVLAGGVFALLSSHSISSYLAGRASGTASASSAALARHARPCPPAPGATGALVACSGATAGPVPASGQPPREPARQAHTHAPARPTAPARPASPGGSPVPAGASAAAVQVLAVINQARAQAGLPAYTLSAGLDRSAAAHTARMAAGCGLSHQCPGEPSLGVRETAAGVRWTAAGENIGDGGPEPATASAITQLAVTLTQDMLSEKPPADAHRRSILSSVYRHIGIAVVRDRNGTVWLTQDFSN